MRLIRTDAKWQVSYNFISQIFQDEEALAHYKEFFYGISVETIYPSFENRHLAWGEFQLASPREFNQKEQDVCKYIRYDGDIVFFTDSKNLKYYLLPRTLNGSDS